MGRVGWMGLVAAVGLGCSGATSDEGGGDGVASKPPMPAGPLPAILASHAQFEISDAGVKTLPAKLVIHRTDGTHWWEETILDPDANVFHKAMAWRGGVLTISGDRGLLKHWTRAGEAWTAATLWEGKWDGKHNRLRDVEVGDVDGDGAEEIVLATHDKGVVAVGDEADGGWTFVELDPAADTFVHEIETGDVDGDGSLEFYATPSGRNKSSGESQAGGVVRYDFVADPAAPSPWVKTQVVAWPDTHAKEILVTNIDGIGPDELFIAREAVTRGKEPALQILEPVRILQATRDAAGTWSQVEIATLQDRGLRFLAPGDVDGDGQAEIVAAGMTSGLWVLDPAADGTWTRVLVDAASGGFEHATHVADLDGDGKLEIYVAADNQQELRRYAWNGSRYVPETFARIPDHHLTWNLDDARL